MINGSRERQRVDKNMDEHLKLEYFYGNEPERFCFYRIPKVLFTKACFASLSTDAKVLYGLMLDLMSSSRSNRWLDKENRVFIQFSIQRAMAYLGCGKDKAMKLFAELDTEKGIGLIERVNRGQGKADIIYVKSFEVPREAEENARIVRFKTRQQDQTFGPTVQKLPVAEETSKSEVVGNSDHLVTEKLRLNVANQEKVVGFSDRSGISTGRISRPQEVGFSDPINNNSINTCADELSVSPSVYKQPEASAMTDRGTERKETVVCNLRKQINYDYLMTQNYYLLHQELVDGIISMIADIVVFAKPYETIRINGMEISSESVRDRFLTIDDGIMEYLVHNLQENYTKVRNKRAYLLTALYNVWDEIDFGYGSQIRYDMYGGGR